MKGGGVVMEAAGTENQTEERPWFARENRSEPCVKESADAARCQFLSMLPHGEVVPAMLCLFVLLTLFSVLVNLLTLFCVEGSEDLSWQPRFAFLKNLILSDLLQTATFGPAVIHSLAQRRTMAFSSWCYVQYFVGSISIFCSLFTITCMALERYLYVCHAIHYLVILTQRRQQTVLAAIWAFSISVGVANVALVHMGEGGAGDGVTRGLLCEPDVMEQHMGFPRAAAIFRKSVGSLTLLLCLLVHAFSYLRIYQDARNAVMPFHAANATARKTVLFYCGMLLLQLLPVLLKVTSDALWELEGNAAVEGGSKAKLILSNVFHLLLLLMLIVPPCINPLVYGLRNAEVRQALLSLLRDWTERSRAGARFRDRAVHIALQNRPQAG